jgi:hypothetical protein
MFARGTGDYELRHRRHQSPDHSLQNAKAINEFADQLNAHSTEEEENVNPEKQMT